MLIFPKIEAIFNDAHHITAEQRPFFGSRCLGTPLWVENDAFSGEKTTKKKFTIQYQADIEAAFEQLDAGTQREERSVLLQLISYVALERGLQWYDDKVSLGCIRMRNDDVNELFEILPRGATVVIQQ